MSTPENAKPALAALDPATGMKLGHRYRVEPTESGHAFEGFFLDGKYFLKSDLLTAVGWLEGQRFIYDQVDGKGEPVFAERYAGDISDLNLTVIEGPVLALTPMDEIEGNASAGTGADGQGQASKSGEDAGDLQPQESDVEHATGQPDEAVDADGSSDTDGDERVVAEDGTNGDGGDAEGNEHEDDGEDEDAVDATESKGAESGSCPVNPPANLLLAGIAGFALGLVIGISLRRHER